MANGDLTAQPLGDRGGLNWVFLVELLVCGVLGLFFLFYFNRLFATIISYIIRAYTWRKYKAYVDITSLQISLLGGRLFFKSLRYQAHNETILIHDGRITWRYWLRKVQDADVYRTAKSRKGSQDSDEDVLSPEKSKEKTTDSSDAESGRIAPQTNLPCRIHVRVSGIEAFLYNHSPSYDHVLSELEAIKAQKEKQRSSTSTQDSPATDSNTLPGEKRSSADAEGQDLSTEVTPSDDGGTTSSASHGASDLPAYLRLFPIQVECKKAAAAVGNENTRSVIVAKTESANGRIDAGQAGGLDIFKLLFMFNLDNVSVSMRQNQDFRELQLQAASRSDANIKFGPSHKRTRLISRLTSFFQSIRAICTWSRSSSSSVRASHSRNQSSEVAMMEPLMSKQSWHGLARFLDEHDKSASSEWDEVEYARLSSLADFAKVNLKFYWDIAGIVRASDASRNDTGPSANDPNGAEPPAYGLELTVKDGTVNYGPWTDRERIILQGVFFPASMVDARPYPAIKVGQYRLSTVFNMSFYIEGHVTLRIPTREASKDWRWQSKSPQKEPEQTNKPFRRKGQSSAADSKRTSKARFDTTKDKRPFGWLDITVSQDTVVHYTMDMYARSDGFHNNLDLHLKQTRITTSVNHDLLWKSGDISVNGNLSNPTSWNSLRTWYFKILVEDLDLYILRDHMFLLTDLITDWTSGPPSNFYTFVPFRYKLDVLFNNFNLYLGANDANLINRPTDPDDNSFLVLRGDNLHVDFTIPLEFYRPPLNTFTFDLVTEGLVLDLLNPPRMTLCDLLEDKRVGTLPILTLKGSHTAYADQSPDLTDTLQMEICGKDLCLTVFGYLLRYFVNFKDNYFGEFLHFRTFEEYQANSADTAFAINEEREKYKFRRSNDLDVILSIIVERPTLLVPANLYSAKRYIRADLPMAEVDLRVTNYYLDLQVDISPISFSFFDGKGDEDTLPSGEQLRIDNVVVTGQRLFGLPPAEPAYVSTWDISAGDISGKCTTEFIHQAIKAGQAFIFAFDDHENALPNSAAILVYDMIFLQLTTGSVELALDIDGSTMYFGFDPIDLHFDDAADSRFSSRLSTRLPNLTIACISTNLAPNLGVSESRRNRDRCTLFLQTTIDLVLSTRKKGFLQERTLQQNHVRKHDIRSARAQFLLDDDPRRASLESDDLPINPPALSLPVLPHPLPSKPARQMGTAGNNHGINSAARAGRLDTRPRGSGREPITSAYLAPPMLSSVSIEAFSDVPPFAYPDGEDGRSEDGLDTMLYDPGTTEEDEEHQSIIVSFNPGIRALIRPEFAKVAGNLANDLIHSEIDDVMDAIQLSVIGKVESNLKRRMGEKSVLDLQVNLPSFVLRTLVDSDLRTGVVGRSHQLDVLLNNLSLAFRLRTRTGEAAGKTVKVLHSTVDNFLLEFSANPQQQQGNNPDLHLEVEDILAWFVLSDANSVKLSFKVLTTSAAIENSYLLASALIQCVEVGASAGKSYMHLDNTLHSRTRTLLLYVSRHHSGVSDPLHLSRMTYVLRAFPEHLRNQDSWKMLARIRHALTILSENQHRHLSYALRDPTSAKHKVTAPLDELLSWCAWDIPAPQETCMYRIISGELEEVDDPTQRSPLQLSISSGLIRVLAGPSNRGSEISVADLNLYVSVQPPSEPTGLMLMEENLRTLVTVVARSSALFTRLKWDLVHAVKPALDAFQATRKQQSPTMQRPKTARLASFETPMTRDDFHFVFSTDTGTAIIDTIHLQHVSEVRNLQVSLIGTSRADKNYGNCISLLMGSERATTELHTQGGAARKIWRTDLTNPSIYVDVRHRLDPKATELNIGGDYGDMVIKIQQEPLGILSIIDRVLTNEVIQVRDIQERISSLTASPASKPESSTDLSNLNKIEINAALLAGTFDVSFAVLQSLSLNVRGKTANLRIKPRRAKHAPLDLEIDVGPIRFAAISRESGLAGEEALFHTPSVGTSAEILLTEERNSLKLSSAIQEMQIEAAAVQNILALLRRPEVQATIEALQGGISDLQRRIDGIFGNPRPPKKEDVMSTEAIFKYSFDITLAGFKIIATAPVKEADANSAELVFGLGLVQLVVDNGFDDTVSKDSYPEIFARIDSIFATLDLLGTQRRRPCGHVQVGLLLQSKPPTEQSNSLIGDVYIKSDALDVEVSADTASTIVDIITHIQQRIVDLDLTKEVDYMKRLRTAQNKMKNRIVKSEEAEEKYTLESLASMAPSNLVISLNHIRFAWIIAAQQKSANWQPEDLELSLARVEFSLRQRNQAKLTIESLQLQMMPKSFSPTKRSMNSALLPEMIFMVKFDLGDHGLSLAFQAVGQAVDIHVESGIAGPLGLLITSGKEAIDKYREASKNWYILSKAESSSPLRSTPFGTRRLTSLLIDVSFAGGILYLRGKPLSLIGSDGSTDAMPLGQGKGSSVQTTLRAPGIALKLEYLADERRNVEPSLTGEIRVDASSNTVYPELVPIILQMSDNAKEAMQTAEASSKNKTDKSKAQNDLSKSGISLPDENLLKSNKLLARTKISFGLRICRQEFGLSCQPIARVNAKALIEDIYISLNTLDVAPGERFIALSASLTMLKASVQHVYSRESTFSFDMDSVNMSVMNSKHIDNSSSGLSAVLKIDPMKTSINARQLQDLLLFREIWMPEQLRKQNSPQTPAPTEQTEELLVQRYRQVAAATAFPWNATVSFTDVSMDIDFGQSIGKSSISIKNMWASSQKTSGWKQELCLGINEVNARSVGRMGGFIELADVKLRTLIEWPIQEAQIQQTPLIQASLGFDQLRVKAAFDYQPFAFADFGGLSFIMYNVREHDQAQANDRLVAALDLGNAYAYFTATSPAQALGLFQAFDRLIQEKQAAFKQSVSDIQKQLQRPSVSSPYAMQALQPLMETPAKPKQSVPIRLRTDVVVRVQTINVGVYPSTFFDSQILKLDAVGGQARFLVDVIDSKIHSNLSLILGQLQVALASAKRIKVPKSISDIRIEEVTENGAAAKGGIILRVPRLVASMQTWQPPEAKTIDYIFKSTFEGKVDVGWNYSRISFIRTMWNTHTRSLAARLGKPLPESAVRITAGPDQKEGESDEKKDGEEEDKGKITAVVNMPISKYEYRALEPPIIETPQLRDMGEATPPLEWIGLQRDRLPNVVHQVVIVSLLELVKEVEDAYGRILGSS
ncbi:CSF1-like protein [Elsinoe australis]|uniref:CSF1-like protein n=1 Tax=Elsinoe australis TaxID=40998 RepID=A0A4U7ATK6_9PEZI|nr:CSF1-like protein [Elsinoe australis]